jgi:glycine dehydrogenase
MISIRQEIKDIEDGKADKATNLIKNAPHTVGMVTKEEWNFPYTREKAAFPSPFNYTEKYWVPVTKIDDAFGDRNLVCNCVPVEAYQTQD